jgi:16S rRNA (cytidine1402-2'-O)-methyltransferase
VTPIPGPSAITSALAASGLPSDRFLYIGFLPRQKSSRRRVLAEVADQKATIIAYESPHRLLDALEDMLAVLGDRRMVAAREMTKLFEEIRRGMVSDMLEHYRATAPRGEFTLVIAGNSDQAAQPAASPDDVRRRLADLFAQGVSASEAARIVAAETGLPRRDVYHMSVRQ